MSLFKITTGVGRNKPYSQINTSAHAYRLRNAAIGDKLLQENVNIDPNRFMRQDKVISIQENQTKGIRMVNMSNDICDDLKLNYLVNTLSEVFLNAIPLDNDYLKSNGKSLRDLFGKQLSELADSPKILLKNFSESNSIFLNELSYEVISEANKDTIDILSKEDDADVEKERNLKKNTKKVDVFGTVDASEIIKNKVLKVLDDENSESEREKSIQDELNSKEGLSEGYSINMNTAGSKLRHYSLFRSIQIDNYKKAVHTVSTLNESTLMASDDGNGIKFNGDALLAESIIRYTMLETLNTLGLKKFSARDVNVLSDNIAYSRYK